MEARTVRWCSLVVALVLSAPAVASAAAPRVLRVGTYRGRRGTFSNIQAAIDAAHPGDWVLVAPGDYHEQGDHRANRGPQDADSPAGVVIAKPDVHLRGMSRSGVIIDGTLPGSPACSTDKAHQDFGVKGDDGKPLGRNGVLVWKADGVSVENLTVCNFLAGAGSAGNEIWFNGGDGTGKIGLGAFRGAYLSATSTFFDGEDTAAQYGIFSSNSRGPGVWDQTYASNFNDSDYYIGACAQVCNQVVDHAQGEYGALGYSGTNSGGNLVIENSEFDHNQDGFDTNSQDNDDAPSPQDGACPGGAVSPITHRNSCWVFTHNFVHDNNNPDVPGAGVASAGPVGTGMTITGGRNDTVLDNRFVNNGAWGVLFLPYPDTEQPPPVESCQGGVYAGPPSFFCLFDDWGDELSGNTFQHNGFFGNDTNSDFGEITTTGPNPTNCFHGNVEAGGGAVTSSPAGLQDSKPACGSSAQPDPNPALTNQVACDSQFFASLSPTGSEPCTPGSNYPRRTQIVMHPLPKGLPTMPNPCAGVPANAWCKKVKHPARAKAKKRRDPDRDGDVDRPGEA